MNEYRITHIRKPDTYSSLQHITHVKYSGVIHTREEVIRLIENGSASFYVSEQGEYSDVNVVRPTFGNPYIKTAPDTDGETRDNLLSLPQC